MMKKKTIAMTLAFAVNRTGLYVVEMLLTYFFNADLQG